jgi:aspartyl-tRNA(Asn)/glutamyl-tRNA(Gln) amidotransferase subunit B
MRMIHEKYEPVIGLEVHAQLQTQAKAFSPDSAAFGADANTHVDPVSLGHPGTLPVLNERVVEYAVRLGLATHSRIAARSVLARKHYFYPDLPKGYQISQYEAPICSGGFVEIHLDEPDANMPRRQIGLTRIHFEEDAGKLLHDQDPYYTLADYNRCGVPLLEIVSEPDIRSSREAHLFMQKIRQIVRYLGICDGNMEEGSLRCDANVSVRLRGQPVLGTKTEIKNMNSFRHVERALEFEIARQTALLEAGERIVQETRLWDAGRMETRSMRSKEEAHDYRYFPDPDLVPVVVGEEVIARISASLPEMPEPKRARFEQELGLPSYDAAVLTEERPVAEYYEETLQALFKITGGGDTRAQAKAVSNFVMGDVLRTLKERETEMAAFPLAPERLAGLVHLRMEDGLSSSGAQELFVLMLDDDREAGVIAAEKNLLQVTNVDKLAEIVREVVENNPKQLHQYLSGKESLIGYFIGQVMRAYSGSPDPKMVRSLIAEHIEGLRS